MPVQSERAPKSQSWRPQEHNNNKLFYDAFAFLEVHSLWKARDLTRHLPEGALFQEKTFGLGIHLWINLTIDSVSSN